MKNDINKRAINTKALIAILFTISLIIFSEQAFDAAVSGLHTWWEVVFPALLPFFIMAEILMGLGVVHFMGTLLEPLMQPIFKVPGVGAFAFAMGLASGYPIGAKITGNLRREKLCTQAEGERLVSFTNTADPLFMIGAVAKVTI
ncbi:sporulation integral membrane protein YlbJ [Orenia metallireducens]|uniref:Sporulation integral membrane protein YlbJ n=1 Tax=Orenia metallireducens TaxID=1413210 RepID=A0A285IAA9_9FIRM|nr:nucleoside recognition domain-containing protein [Orenia metallireducens]PRX21205.1 sporulation integral membrane protein YlbJ [Orenia metallireducens]SNY44843.1 sporulation integral membrane protein YlbJ [Orenia metallireducens]